MSDSVARLNAALEGRYAIERELGEGGMATVYLADDLKHERKVALKVLNPQVGHELGVERFLREIRIAAGLSHPNILPLFDSGEADGLLYFVMPYVEGETLRHRLARERKLPVEDVVRLVSEIGEALGRAHEAGLVHRDIKPENILLESGHALVADFGVARAVHVAGGDRLTRTGLAVGTPAYMSPEQAAGDALEDSRSDIYSLACLAYEMLAGEPPFTGSSYAAVIAGHVARTVPELRPNRSDVPLGAERAIGQALSKDPADRFATATDFAAALSAAVTAEAIAVDERQVGRRRLARSLVGATAVVVTAFGGWWLIEMLVGPSIERIAVLPASNLTRDPEQDYFVDGVHEALVLELQRAGISTIARQSVLQYRDTDKPIRQIATELVVDALVQLSVGREADSVVVDVSLYDSESGLAFWSRSFSARFEGMLGLYRDISRRVADQIGVVLSGQAEARLAERPFVDPEAYEVYLNGGFHLRAATPPDLALALEYFEAALAIDPNYAAAHVGVASVWGYRVQFGLASPEEARAPAEEHLARALELDDQAAEVHHLQAQTAVWRDWDWEAGEAACRRTLALDPGNAQAHEFYGHLLMILGRWDEAAEQGELGLELDRRDPFVIGLYATQLHMVGRSDEAIELLEQMREDHPGQGFGRAALAEAYLVVGRSEEAFALRREIFDSSGQEDAVAALDLGLQQGGFTTAWARVADTLVVRARETFVRGETIARHYAMAGENDKAVEWVRVEVEQRGPNAPYLGMSPVFADLHEHAGFQELVREIGVPLLRGDGG